MCSRGDVPPYDLPAEVWCSRCEQPSLLVIDGEALCEKHALVVAMEANERRAAYVFPEGQ